MSGVFSVVHNETGIVPGSSDVEIAKADLIAQGLVNGHMLVVCVAQYNDAGSGDWATNLPTGFSSEVNVNTAGNDSHIVLIWKKITDLDNEPAVWTFIGGSAAFEKLYTVAVLDAISASIDAAKTSAYHLNRGYIGLPAITTASDGAIVLAFGVTAYGSSNDPTNVWAASDYSTLGSMNADASQSQLNGAFLGYQVVPTAGAVPTDNANIVVGTPVYAADGTGAAIAFEADDEAGPPPVTTYGTPWTFGQVEFRLELAVGAEGGYASIWDEALWDTSGIWGGGAPVWVDVSEYALDAATSRGRQRYGERMRAATATFTLDNTTGLFNPDPPVTPPGALELRPGRLVRLSGRAGGSWVILWTGYVQALDPIYGPGAANPRMRFYAQGFMASLAQSNPPALSTPIAAGQSTSARVSQILETFEWPDWLPPTLQTGTHTMSSSSLERNSLDEIQRAAEAEGGTYFHAADGTPLFKARGWLNNDTRSTTIQADIGYDEADSPQVVGADTSWDALNIINDAQLLRAGGSTVQRARSTLSETLYGPKTVRKTVECETDAQALALAQDLVNAYELDRLRIDRVELWAPDQATAAIMFGLEIGDLVDAQIATVPGWSFDAECHVQGIGYTISGEDWSQWLRLDDSYTREA
jgi:hypothetical protein